MNIPESITTTKQLKEWLKENDFDGLFYDDCACALSDLATCGEGFRQCEPGYSMPCDCGDHDEHIGNVRDLKQAIMEHKALADAESREIERLREELRLVFKALKEAALMQGEVCPFEEIDGHCFDIACEIHGNNDDGINSCRASRHQDTKSEYQKCWIGYFFRTAEVQA